MMRPESESPDTASSKKIILWIWIVMRSGTLRVSACRVFYTGGFMQRQKTSWYESNKLTIMSP